MSIADLNAKITRSKKDEFSSLQCVSLYGHDETESGQQTLKSLNLDTSGNLKVAGTFGLPSGSATAENQLHQLFQLTKVADCVDTGNDRLKVDIEDASGQGLATETKQDDNITQTTKVGNCVDAVNNRLKVDLNNVSGGLDLATENKQDDNITQTTKIANCVDTINNRLKVDIEDTSGQGLATETKQDDNITQTTKVGDCVDTGNNRLAVSLDNVDGAIGLATATNQTTGNGYLQDIELNTQPKAPALNRTEAIPVQLMVGSGGANYDALRSIGQDLSVYIDDMNSDVANNSGLAKETTLVDAEAHLGTIDTNTTGILASHYADGDAIGGTDTGVLAMGRDNSNNAHPLHITSNGDLEVEIADFVKGQKTMASSFPVVVASDQPTFVIEEEKNATTLEFYNNVSLTANTPSTVINIGNHKNIQIVGKTSTSTAKIGISYEAIGSGAGYYTDGTYANLYNDGSVYHFALTVQGIGAENIKIYPQVNASNVYLTYHIF